MSELADKERRAIKILRMYRGDDPIEVSYSGGKDSDVILALTKMAGIPYRAIYKNTTIDPPIHGAALQRYWRGGSDAKGEVF